MAQIDPAKMVRDGVVLTTVVACLSSVSGIAEAAAPVLTETARNPNNFVLTLEMHNFVNGGWSGDANFTISACPQAKCRLYLSGPIKIVSSPQSEVTAYEGFFPVTGLPCAVHFEQLSYGGMDSGDYRLTLVSKDKGARGCSSLPAGLAGVYKQVVRQSRAEGAQFQILAGPAFEALASRTDAACPDGHARFFNAGDLAWEEETFEENLGAADRAKIRAAIERTPDGAPRSCENRNGLSCSASSDLEAIEKAGQMERFATYVCATKPPQ
jgi:hypothetical protein